jgi:glyceraldehyde 3-phosphate dehydrogenase
MGYGFGINGFGRIGRLVARIMIDDPNSKLLAINTGADASYMAYQFKYDTIHGRWKGSLEVDGDDLVINGQRVKTTHYRQPNEIPWKNLGVDYLCESTGVFLTADSAKPHVDAGVKKVIPRFPFIISFCLVQTSIAAMLHRSSSPLLPRTSPPLS